MQLPAALKQRLIEDWRRVEQGEAQALPARPAISDILQQYVESTRGGRDSVDPEEEVSLFSTLHAVAW